MIIKDDGSRREEVYRIWQRNFQDPVSYADFYFDRVYGKNEVLLYADRDQVCGMVHLNPYTLCLGGKKTDASYIVGVATDEAYRRTGIMRKLLKETFEMLADRGQAITYLMPANEAYYLPFDFRFGMEQLEQEIQILDPETAFGQESRAGDFRITDQASPEQLEELARMENEVKASRFDIFTQVSPDYYTRLGLEAVSDYGRLFYVFEGDRPAGRFAAGLENGCLLLSRIFCRDMERTGVFLQAVLSFCEKKYHYRHFQLIMDGAWEPFLLPPGPAKGLRFYPVKREKKIMFRILDPAGLSGCFSSGGDFDGIICLEDAFFPRAEGCYRLHAGEGKLEIIRLEETGQGAQDFGKITMADLTRVLLSDDQERQQALKEADLTERGRKALDLIRPARRICVMEIV
ncbi:MAG: GNAT family N-acetyltransferase [Eubacterium sp.]|nr:GNAT family N-acetyltransferase [Eubacterium sp.]